MAKRNAPSSAAAPAAPPPEATPIRIRVDQIEPYPGLNSREDFNDEELRALAGSIAESGLIQRLTLHETHGPVKYLVAGERRLRAVKLLGWEEVPATIREYTEKELHAICLAENLGRADLNPIEEARGYQRAVAGGMTQAEIGRVTGKSQPVISNAIRVLQLPEDVLAAVAAGRLNMSDARDHLLPFVGIPEAKRTRLYQEVLKHLKNGQNVEHVVGQAAAKLSRPVSDDAMTYVDYDSKGGQRSPLFDAALHEGCTCGGPKFKYGHRAAVRCFDDSWWNARQAEAQEQLDQQARKQQERLKKAEQKAGAAVQMNEARFEKLFNAQPYQANIESELLDASLLADAQLVVVKRSYGGEIVCCADVGALRKARGAVKKERERILQERRAARGQKDRTEASATKIEPWMLAQVLTARPHGDTLLALGRELGMDCGKHGAVDAAVQALPAGDLELLFKVVALRSKRGDLAEWSDPLKEAVDKETEKKYRIGMNALKRRALEAAGLAKPKKEKKAKPAPHPQFMQPLQPDETLAAVVGAEPRTRTEITKKLWAYIQKHGLQDKTERRMINADENLAAVFDGKKQVSMFEMTKLVNRHLGITEAQPQQEEAQELAAEAIA